MKNRHFAVILVLGLFAFNQAFTQTAPFNISLEPINISGLGGLQSYSFGQDNGKWLIV
jgi:hypothetical protein